TRHHRRARLHGVEADDADHRDRAEQHRDHDLHQREAALGFHSVLSHIFRISVVVAVANSEMLGPTVLSASVPSRSPFWPAPLKIVVPFAPTDAAPPATNTGVP